MLFYLLIQDIVRDGTSFATFDHSDIRGFDRYDLTSSRSCLGLVAEVRRRPYSLGFLEDSPNVVAPLSMPWIFCVSFFTRSFTKNFPFCSLIETLYAWDLNLPGNRPQETGKLACNGCDHFVSLFPPGHKPPEPTAQPDLRLPGNLSDGLRQPLLSFE